MNWKKNLTVFVVLGLVILGTLAMSGCTENNSGDGKVIITGSSTVKPIASSAASIFNQDHDDVKVEVSGGGSGHGIASLGKGEADIGMASREIKQSEIDEYSDIDFVDHQIAKDGVAIIVSQDIYQEGVIDLTTEEVYDIYTKEITNWKEVGGPDKNIFVVERQEGSGTRATFMDALGLNSVDSDAAKPENAQVKSAVKSSDNGIGYVGLGYVGSDTPSIKLNGIGASEETIKSGDYPISRSLHMYTDGEAKGNVKDFIDFIMSSEGQNIVDDEGFIPVSGGGGGSGELSGTLTITGSTTVQPIAAPAADAFMDKHSKVTVQISGGGSSHGIASVGKGEADIGDASREIKQSEIDEYPDVDFYDNEIAKDGVAIIVSKDIHDAGVNDLTVQQVYDIYTKEITTWDEVGGPSKPIQVVERQEGSGTRSTFMNAIGLDSTDADAAKPENAQVKSAVKSSNNGIGYVGLGYVGSDTPSIKLDGVEPTEENIVNGDYEIGRSLHMYTDGEPTGLTKAFIDFVLSDEGQQIVADEGFIPMN
ncbi:MAG: phosphate ABC transporter substrate-binding protein, partial [Thermoplasmatota archaeon]